MGKALWKKETILRKLKELKTRRDTMLKNVSSLHVRLQPGNDKTGVSCWTISILPIIDCLNCAECMWECYDFKSDLRFDRQINDRCRNSVIHMLDVERYWNEIDAEIKAKFVRELRINVGGDMSDADFNYVAQLGRNNPRTSMLFFTKNYKGINKFLENNKFPKNVHPIMSAWKNLEMDNPNNLPEAHVLYEDGKTTAPKFGAKYCTGNCTECAFYAKGCWTLKKGEHVIFKAH